MNVVKTTALLTLMTLLFLFTAQALGMDLISSLFFAFVFNFIMYFYSAKLALASTKAKKIEEGQYQEVVGVVTFLTQKENMPMPDLYIIESDQPNAFATGRNPENGAVAVTTGLLNMLNEDEVLAVVAHELAHIKNRDTLIMTITATLAGAISMLANFAFFFGGNRGRGGHPIVMILVAIIAPLAAMLVQMAISRRREYAADYIGAKICKHPLALASALEKISSGASRIDNMDAENNPSTAHLFIINPLHARAVDGLFSTHPNAQNRIQALREMVLNEKN